MESKPFEVEDKIASEIVKAAYDVHMELGPVLLEKVYEICMEYELIKKGVKSRTSGFRSYSL
jgi:GxxExxY protein